MLVPSTFTGWTTKMTMKIAIAKAKKISRNQDFSSNESLNPLACGGPSFLATFGSSAVKRVVPSLLCIQGKQILGYQTNTQNSNGFSLRTSWKQIRAKG
jgi:hypothetical protein